jgi:pyridoxal phosphate enzyme (YggS family)
MDLSAEDLVHQKKITEAIGTYKARCNKAELLAVSKLKPLADILIAYNVGQRHFAENYVQELVDKYENGPKDIFWHFIGHLQSNKVKYIIPFVHLIHSVDSHKLLLEISKQALKANREVSVLLQIFIAKEETKFGFDFDEAETLMAEQFLNPLPNIKIVGLMGMASNTENKDVIREEFFKIAKYKADWAMKFECPTIQLTELSIGMSQDIDIALEAGSTMVRIGTAIFGSRAIKS